MTIHNSAPCPHVPARSDGDVLSLCDLLIGNLVQTSSAIASLLSAQEARIGLAPDLMGFAARLQQGGLTVVPLDHADDAVTGSSGPRALPPVAGRPTDLVDLALDVPGGADGIVARLDVLGVPGAWDTRATQRSLAPLTLLLHGQIRAMQGGMALLAPAMLALLERLRDYDDHAASHLVTGFLRLMAGAMPTQVEVTALCIAGLSDMPAAKRAKTDVALNAVALGLLDDLGLGHDPRPIGQPLDGGLSDADADHASGSPSGVLAPFAHLQLLERSFAVAEDEATGWLWFRPMHGGDEADWLSLQMRAQDGWTHVAREIIAKTMDVQRAFATMHVIRRRDIATTEVAEIYDLHGLVWWLRHSEAAPEARLDAGPWLPLTIRDNLQGKPRAIEALFQLLPNLSDLLDDKARDWVQRMAQTVQVTPILMTAAE
jgi:hypothetical protein